MRAISREEFAQKYEREWGTSPLAKNAMEGLTRQEQEFARFMYDVLQLVDSAHYLDRSVRSLELACRVAREAAAHFAVWSSDGEKPECDGHESLDGAHMGETVYCDGSCRG